MLRPYLYFFIFFIILSCQNEDPNNGTRKSYFDGSDKIQQTVEYKNGKKNGYFTEYYKNGSIMSKQFYVNDTITDSSLEYHENGKLATSQFYKMGVRQGVWKKFNKDGLMYLEATYKDGQLNGPSNKYTYITGKPLERLNFINGVPVGKQEYFYNNGKPKSSYIALFNKMTELKEWTESGKPKNLDFKISISEKNRLVMDNNIILIARLENPDPDDVVYEGVELENKTISPFSRFVKVGDHFEFQVYVSKGGFVMKKFWIVAKRKTSLGNTFEKIVSYNLSATNY